MPSTAPDFLPPEIDLLLRRWALPPERVADLRRLLDAQAEGGTACPLPPGSPADPSAWGQAVATAPKIPAPLLLRPHAGATYLQSWRYHRAEQTIAAQLQARAAQPAPRLGRPAADWVVALGSDQLNALQTRAVTCALDHTLALITGGPGTGKTHTLARLLALLLADQPERRPVIRLAAPTGKAAERMREAIEAAADRLPASLPTATPGQLKAAAAGACTLHSLLGFHPTTGRCRHNAQSPLRSDVLIVDECSMVDTLLWQALLLALPPTTRLILLGDPHQLESVAAGDVLGALVRHARRHPAGPLASVWVELTESQRFKHRAGIGALANAVVHFDAPAALALLHGHRAADDPADGLTWLGDHGGRFSWETLPPSVRAALAAVADATEPAAALAALAHVRLLTAHREHLLGAAGINAAIDRQLRQRPGLDRAPNEPIIINHNDAETGLTNGSVGVIMDDVAGRAAFFPAASANLAPRRFPLGQIPDCSPAWALTIHRAQGSEFDHVVVVLPDESSPLATRELVYTAITRAKNEVYLWGSTATVVAALSERALRCTLLEACLAGN
ncbi:MAG: exodeoxyribonuclease V subunit alpha [Verrucomicrobia bacterium]|nr:exodeoxyribonuclease V subunit alpha [Verrucomicrobiota bacterium]